MAEALVRDAAARIGFAGGDLDAVCGLMEKEFVREAWQLPHIDSAQWCQLGAPIGLVAAVRHAVSCGQGSELGIVEDSCGHSAAASLQEVLQRPELVMCISFYAGAGSARDLAQAAANLNGLLQPVLAVVATHCNSRLFAWGGLTSDACSDVYVFHPLCNMWSVVDFYRRPPQMNAGVVAEIDGYVYVCCYKEARMSRVSLKTRSWESLPWHGKPHQEGYAVCDGCLFVFDGVKLARFDPRTVVWQDLVPDLILPKLDMPPRTECAMAALGQHVYIMCGQTRGDRDLSHCWRFHSGSSVCNALPDAPTARHGCVGVSLGNRVFVLGGRRSPEVTLRCVEHFDPVQMTWTSCCPMATPRAHLNAFAWGTRLYILGGHFTETHYQHFHNGVAYNPVTKYVEVQTLAEYDINENAWEQERPVPYTCDEDFVFFQMLCSPADYRLDRERFPNNTLTDVFFRMLSEACPMRLGAM